MPCIIARYIACILAFAEYINMFGDRHLKQYFVEDHICAVVVRSLRLHSISDHICEDMIRTI